MTRDEWHVWWRAIGGEPQLNVTMKTQLVVVGDNPGLNKRDKALRYSIPYIRHELLDLVNFHWRRADNALVDINAPWELCILWLELLDGIYAHYLRTRDQRLGRLTSFCAAVLEGILRITRGSPIEGPSGESRAVVEPDDPTAYVQRILQATVIVAEELQHACNQHSCR